MSLLTIIAKAVRGDTSDEPTQAERVVRVETQRKEARLELEQAIAGLARARAARNAH